MSNKFDPYHQWLDISPAEQPADYYRLLGVEAFCDDEERIRDQADQRMAKVRLHQNGKHSRTSQKILNELSAARSCLLNGKLKRIYDQKLARILEKRKLPTLNPPSDLLPEESLPQGYDPFHGTGRMNGERDPLEPVTHKAVWPYVVAAVGLFVVALTLVLVLKNLR